MTFLRKPEILKGIHQINHLRKPSKIQERALPLLLGEPPQNLITQFESSTDKIDIFTLNILHRLDINNPNPQALALTFSRELARNISLVVQERGQFIDGLKVTAAIPNPNHRGQKLEGHVIVGTPGIVIDRIRRKMLDSRHIKILVLDEADYLLGRQLGDLCMKVKE